MHIFFCESCASCMVGGIKLTLVLIRFVHYIIQFNLFPLNYDNHIS